MLDGDGSGGGGSRRSLQLLDGLCIPFFWGYATPDPEMLDGDGSGEGDLENPPTPSWFMHPLLLGLCNTGRRWIIKRRIPTTRSIESPSRSGEVIVCDGHTQAYCSTSRKIGTRHLSYSCGACFASSISSLRNRSLLSSMFMMRSVELSTASSACRSGLLAGVGL